MQEAKITDPEVAELAERVNDLEGHLLTMAENFGRLLIHVQELHQEVRDPKPKSSLILPPRLDS